MGNPNPIKDGIHIPALTRRTLKILAALVNPLGVS